ncbi:MAG: transketolase [Clostridiales bacterium]|nr:transketolase [Clostridiales bacterium]
MNKQKQNELKLFAAKVRRWVVEGVYSANSGHPGGSLSCTDIITYLYNSEMRIDPKDPKNPDRDRFVLSKGHCAPALYSVLGLKGYFDINEMKNLRKLGSFLQGHPCIQETPGIDMSTGSLGQGVSSAVGMALAAKVDKKDYNVFTVLGDGEMQEGEVWEALMSAAHYKLDNLCAFLDNNGLQIDGKVDDVMSLGDVAAKASAFGWNVMTIDGHDFEDIEKAVEAFKAHKGEGKPFFAVAKTHKGMGVSFMTDNAGFHGKAPNADEYQTAVSELDSAIAALEQEVAL